MFRWFWRMFTGIDNDFVNACTNGDLRKVKILHKRGADIHTWYDESLRFAAYYGYLHVVKYLMEHGGDIHAINDAALRWAVYYGHLDVANYLREAAGARFKCHECLIKSTCLELCKDFRAGEK